MKNHRYQDMNTLDIYIEDFEDGTIHQDFVEQLEKFAMDMAKSNATGYNVVKEYNKNLRDTLDYIYDSLST